jgi:class 3 adenylate cyclase
MDDIDTLERLRSLRRNLINLAIAEHGGRIVNTGGDSLLMVFDSMDGAVRCAVRVQQQMLTHDGDHPPEGRIRFRIERDYPKAIEAARRALFRFPTFPGLSDASRRR